MDQRQHPRFPVRFRSSFTSVNLVDGEGHVLDVSLRGCRIYSLTEVHPGTTLELRIHSAEHEPPINVEQAVVRWNRDHHFGIEFVTLQPEEWARLQHTVTELERQPYQQSQETT